MKIIRGINNFYQQQPIAATIGNFDGVHLGHQKIIEQLCAKAKILKLCSALITFEPSAQEFFMRSNAPARLTRMREKLEILKHTDLNFVVVLPFNQALANKNAEQFVREFLQNNLQVHYLLVGDDFHFGKNRLGDFSLLESMANEKFRVEKSSTIKLHDERVSSSRIRFALESGDLATTERLLGWPYSMFGRVVKGQQRGRTIGFPTANVLLKRHRSPVLGVYAVKVYGLERQAVFGVANVGNRPTVDGVRSLLEVYLFDFNKDIYGKKIQVEFCNKIRDEKRFDSFELLKQQIADDVNIAKKYFALH